MRYLLLFMNNLLEFSQDVYRDWERLKQNRNLVHIKPTKVSKMHRSRTELRLRGLRV